MMTQAAQLCQKYKMIILFPIRSSLAKKKGGGEAKRSAPPLECICKGKLWAGAGLVRSYLRVHLVLHSHFMIYHSLSLIIDISVLVAELSSFCHHPLQRMSPRFLFPIWWQRSFYEVQCPLLNTHT